MKYIFLDLDECLLHTTYFYKEDIDSVVEGFGIFKDESYTYVAQLRNGALDLLKRIREIVPEKRVFMLTSSVEDYANHWNSLFKLGFAKHQIYNQKDIENCRIEPLCRSRFPEAETYLIDNLSRHENRSKIEFLRAIDSNPTYIQISEFFRSPKDDLTEEEINSIIDKISHE